MMAEMTPVIGGAPDATAMPSESGSDTNATCKPAPRSKRQCLRPASPFFGCALGCISRDEHLVGLSHATPIILINATL